MREVCSQSILCKWSLVTFARVLLFLANESPSPRTGPKDGRRVRRHDEERSNECNPTARHSKAGPFAPACLLLFPILAAFTHKPTSDAAQRPTARSHVDHATMIPVAMRSLPKAPPSRSIAAPRLCTNGGYPRPCDAVNVSGTEVSTVHYHYQHRRNPMPRSWHCSTSETDVVEVTFAYSNACIVLARVNRMLRKPAF